jgi:signal transduction histidine kinase
VLTIEDDGPGIPTQVLPRLFEPFFTTKPTGKGTGLGLSISYDIIKRMGGDITAENRSEGGARFMIVLPALGQVLPELRTAA